MKCTNAMISNISLVKLYTNKKVGYVDKEEQKS